MTLHDYQVDGVEHLLGALRRDDGLAPSALMLDDPGTGKTVMTSVAAHLLPDRPLVLSCPAGLRRQWDRHLRAWAPGRRVVRVETEAQARTAAVDLVASRELPAPALVLSHDNLAAAVRGQASPLRSLLRRRAVLGLDEVHLGKSPTSARGRGFRDAVIAAHAGGGCAWGLTATPMPRDPIDLWQILKWMRLADDLFPGGDGRCGLDVFATDHFGGRVFGGRWRFPATPPGGALAQLARVALRRRREDVLPFLPEKIREVRVVPVDGAPLALLERVARAAALACGVDPESLARGEVGDRHLSVALEVGRRLEDLTELRVELARAKVPALLARIAELEEVGTPLAIYSDHLAPILALGAEDERGVWRPREGWVVVRGEDSEKKRDQAVRAFEDGEHPDGRPVWGIGYTGAGRVGLNLNRAQRLIVVSRSWAHAGEEQAEDRVLRFGKVFPPTIEYLLAQHPVELLMHRVLAAKRERSEVALEACVDRPDRLDLPSVSTDPDLRRLPWMSHKRLTTWRDCRFSYFCQYGLGVRPARKPESRRLGILFAAAIAGRLVVWSRDREAARGPEGEAAAVAEVRRECAENEWPQQRTTTEADGRTAVALSLRTMERFGFFAGRWDPYLINGRPAVEIELRVPMVPAGLPLADRDAAVAAASGWAGFYGRADLIAYDREHRGGTGQPRLTVIDFKCKERMSEGLSDGADDLQLMLYLYAARALGIPAELAARVETRNALPEEPPTIRGGKLSKDKSLVTDAAMYEAAIKRLGLPRSDYAEHLDWLAREGPRLYAHVQCGRTQSALETVWREMLCDAAAMQGSPPVRNLRNFASSPCHSERFLCENKELCTATLTGVPTPQQYADDLVRTGTLVRSSHRRLRAEDHKADAAETAGGPAAAPQEEHV